MTVFQQSLSGLGALEGRLDSFERSIGAPELTPEDLWYCQDSEEMTGL